MKSATNQNKRIRKALSQAWHTFSFFVTRFLRASWASFLALVMAGHLRILGRMALVFFFISANLFLMSGPLDRHVEKTLPTNFSLSTTWT